MEIFGLTKFRRTDPDLNRWTLRSAFCYFQHFSMLCFLFLHFLSTVGRSIRHMTEFLQMFYEDLVFFMSYIGAVIFLLKYADILALCKTMEKSFSKADGQIILSCEKKVRVIVSGLMSSVVCIGVSNLFEKNLPLSANTLEEMKSIYRTKYPERRLFLNVWIPSIDETESWYYEVIYALELYPFILLMASAAVIVTLPLILITHIEGQYKMLCTYVEKLGHNHTDILGYTIFYTNIERNQYVRDVIEPSAWQASETNAQRKRLLYEQLYMRQLVKFHQKLSKFEFKVLQLLRNNMLLSITLTSTILCLCLYQLTLSDETLSHFRLYKFISELITISGSFYYLCHCSDKLDDCHANLRRALSDNAWYRCTNRTKRDLVFLLRRLQKPNHLTFGRGAIVLSKAFFVQIVKTSYNFVNCMRYMGE